MKLEIRDLTICSLFVALIAVGAFIKIDIPLPLYTMHFTLQWLFVIMAALLLGAKRGAVCVLAYLCIGLMGIPVFAAGGGLAYIFRPGFGFLLGFLAAAICMGIMVDNMSGIKFLKLLFASSIGMLVYYSFGAVYFYIIKNLYMSEQVLWSTIVVQYCLITVIPDFILCVLASKLCVTLKPVLKKMLFIEGKKL